MKVINSTLSLAEYIKEKGDHLSVHSWSHDVPMMMGDFDRYWVNCLVERSTGIQMGEIDYLRVEVYSWAWDLYQPELIRLLNGYELFSGKVTEMEIVRRERRDTVIVDGEHRG